MHSGMLKTAAVLGALSVALGAFGAHALKSLVSDTAVNTFETGVRYQFYHVFAIALAGILYSTFSNKWVLLAARMFITGIILFSGSLYMLTALSAIKQPGLRWIGAITPVGGVAFILGWLFLFAGVRSAASKAVI